jgi:hypothetical protein
VSAAAKRAPEPAPTPFPSPERAALAHAIAAAADASARKVALEQASQTANAEVLRAIEAAEAALGFGLAVVGLLHTPSINKTATAPARNFPK